MATTASTRGGKWMRRWRCKRQQRMKTENEATAVFGYAKFGRAIVRGSVVRGSVVRGSIVRGSVVTLCAKRFDDVRGPQRDMRWTGAVGAVPHELLGPQGATTRPHIEGGAALARDRGRLSTRAAGRPTAAMGSAARGSGARARWAWRRWASRAAHDARRVKVHEEECEARRR